MSEATERLYKDLVMRIADATDELTSLEILKILSYLAGYSMEINISTGMSLSDVAHIMSDAVVIGRTDAKENIEILKTPVN